MKYVGEVEAENLLEKEGFRVIRRHFCSSKNDLVKGLTHVGVPFVMKVSGKNIIHKAQLGGIRLDVKTFSQAEVEFNDLKKIKGADGVMLQEKIPGKEFLIGVKKTPEFGHVIVFGSGGSNVEEKKDVNFRVCPIERADAYEMIKETQASRGLLKEEGLEIENVLLKICKFTEKYSSLEELDINPLKVVGNKSVIVDARMVFS